MKHPIACLITIFSNPDCNRWRTFHIKILTVFWFSLLWNSGNRNKYFSHAVWWNDHHLGWCSHTCEHIDDGSISEHPQRITNTEEMPVRLLGVSPQNTHNELGMIQRHSARLEWLYSKFSDVTDADSHICIMYCVRAYLLYLVGYTIFANKSGTRVSMSYLLLFEDLDRVSSYAWGAAALAYLYRQLDYASRTLGKHIVGF